MAPVTATVLGTYPRLAVSDAAAAIDCYRDVFGAVETARYTEDGRIVEAELRFGPSRVSVRDETDDDRGPLRLGGTSVILAVETDDPDSVAAALAERGGRVVFPVTDHPYGRAGRVEDAYGHQWMVIRPV